jgi:hypothetical protein
MTLGVDWMAWQVGLLGRIGKTDNRRKGETPDVSPDQTNVELVSYVGNGREEDFKASSIELPGHCSFISWSG